jgi:hypothetical protein
VGGEKVWFRTQPGIKPQSLSKISLLHSIWTKCFQCLSSSKSGLTRFHRICSLHRKQRKPGRLWAFGVRYTLHAKRCLPLA